MMMNLEVTDSMLEQLESSEHQTSGMCESESGVSTHSPQQYRYLGTFGAESDQCGNSPRNYETPAELAELIK